MTEFQRALRGEITPVLKKVADDEHMEPGRLRRLVAEGRAVITGTAREHCRAIGIGSGLKTKVNANIGTSPAHDSMDVELEKLRVSIDAGADTVMDLSTGGDLDAIRRAICAKSTSPLGTVPVYQTIVETVRSGREVPDAQTDAMFEVVERHARDGVDFLTIHCGLVRRLAEAVAATRTAGVVSRGGCFLLQWMIANKRENPYYEHYDRLLDIAEKYDVALSLGDGLRPGAIADATDAAQMGELLVIGELVDRARARGVSVIVEGPGHVPLQDIPSHMIMQKRITKGAPFYVLGPLVTDVAPGYDHITSAIGGAVAAWYGADFLCYVTPAEHLRLPSIEDVREGVIAARIAAHAGDIAKGLDGASDWDLEVSRARAELDWELALSKSIDPETARGMFDPIAGDSEKLCSMCGIYCAIRGTRKTRNGRKRQG
ncbi:MAG: phosphomethylpyrimidine synthase ThiC [Candidatus Krumholzibacteria bacterium]|nr:phosphomethylpyrimidine synthase ThiC [Candidatus Krumholzibacteria bacterium]